MSERAEQLLQELLGLNLLDRIDVANRLEESIEAELPEPPPGMSEEGEHAELLRRLASVEDGTAEVVPFDEAMKNIRDELARRQAARDTAER